MLISENRSYTCEAVIIMTEKAVIAASTKSTLDDISKQAEALGTGLLNISPGLAQSKASANQSVEYLLAISDNLSRISERCAILMTELLQDKRVR